ncbi:MAG: hypothetical protein RL499_1246, partial [Actinomycetota bacterium]
MRRAAVLALVVGLALSGCAAPAPVPSLDAVRDERSATITAALVRAAMAAEEYIERDWPEAVHPPLAFERWVESDRAMAEAASCLDRILERRAGAISPEGVYTLAPRPTTEPEWEIPVAQLRCSIEVIPWSGEYPFGGPVELEWVRHQLSVALPNCVRRWGAELVIADFNAAMNASIYPTLTGNSAEPVQTVWLAATLRNADIATARQIRATCPDPGR